MRLLKSAIVVAALALASPVWANGGHDKQDKHHRNHHGWDDHRHHSEWRHHRDHSRYYEPQYYAGPRYYAPYPVYGYAPAPAPGVHIVVPNIYIPLR